MKGVSKTHFLIKLLEKNIYKTHILLSIFPFMCIK